MVPWSAMEDNILLSAVADAGPRKDWRAIAARLPGRSAAAARYRWRECNVAVRGRAESAAYYGSGGGLMIFSKIDVTVRD